MTKKYFRNLVITDSSYSLKFEDKTEVELSNVTFKNPISLDIYNRDHMIKMPTVRVTDSIFPAKVDVTQTGFNPGSFNKIRVENDHVAEDTCAMNSSGQVIIIGNRFGFVSSGDIEFKGGEKLM